jgi:hypothetical protein
MRFYAPGPKGVEAPGILSPRVPASQAYRRVLGADGRTVAVFQARPNTIYSGSAGNNVVITCYRIGGTRYRCQVWNSRTEAQIEGNITSVTGIGPLITAFKADAVLNRLFFVRVGNTTDQNLVDTEAGLAAGKRMTGGVGD